MTTSTLSRGTLRGLDAAASGIVDDRGVTFRTTAAIELAKGDDDDLLVGIEVLKVGTFKGWVFDEPELAALVARFAELRDADVFVPPFRIDHSWDVLSVVGWFEALYVAERPDRSDSGTLKPYLLGDVRLCGTPEENAQLRAWITSKKLRNRSSEVFPYETNTGRLYSSVFAGCAFVDVPAVEGLSPITLSRTRPTPTARGGVSMSTTATETTPTPEGATAPAGGTATPTPPVDERLIIGEGVDASDTPDEGAAPAEPVAAEPEVVEPVADPAADPPGAPSVQLRVARHKDEAEDAYLSRAVDLRVQAATRLTTFRTAGVVPPSVEQQVVALLHHSDAAVRDGVSAILSQTRPPVALREKLGALASAPKPGEATDASGTPVETQLIHANLTAEQVGEAWAGASPEDRRKFRSELNAWHAEHPAG